MEKIKHIDFENLKITPKLAFILMKVSQTKFKSPIHIQELKSLIEINPTDPYFTLAKKLLLTKEVASQKVSFGNTKLLSIDIKKLDDLIETTEVYNKVVEYIKLKNFFYMI